MWYFSDKPHPFSAYADFAHVAYAITVSTAAAVYPVGGAWDYNPMVSDRTIAVRKGSPVNSVCAKIAQTARGGKK